MRFILLMSLIFAIIGITILQMSYEDGRPQVSTESLLSEEVAKVEH